MIAGAKLHIILFLAKISVKKMSFRTHMWHKTIDYHFSAFGFRACACFNPNRPLGRNEPYWVLFLILLKEHKNGQLMHHNGTTVRLFQIGR